MSAWNGLNRRKFPRVKYPCLVVIRDQEGGQNALLTHTENLGIGGVCVMIKKNLKIYAPVELEIDLLDLNDHIRCRGKVVWAIRHKEADAARSLFYDIGIEFIDLEAKDLQRIERVIVHLAKHSPQSVEIQTSR